MDVWQRFDDIVLTFKSIQHGFPQSKLMIVTKDTDKAKDIIELHGVEISSVEILSCHNTAVSHYISDANFAFIFRDYNILNKVAAPIKISEYLDCNLYVLYKGLLGDYNHKLKVNDVGYDCQYSDGILDWISNKKDNHLINGSQYTYNFKDVLSKYDEIWFKNDFIIK